MEKAIEPVQKITVNLPTSMIEDMMEISGKGLTESLREAIKTYRNVKAHEALRAMRGKIDFGLTYKQIKEERE